MKLGLIWLSGTRRDDRLSSSAGGLRYSVLSKELQNGLFINGRLRVVNPF
jgi:hypothetical protein